MTSGVGTRRYAIIPTHNRHELLTQLVIALTPQVNRILVIDNASDPRVSEANLRAARDATADAWDFGRGRFAACVVARDEEQPPNLSRLWQAGLAQVAAWEPEATYDVAILNDDAEIYPGWFDILADSMREQGAAAACTWPSSDVGLGTGGNLLRWLYGPAFIIRGELARKPGDPLWPDERLRWWGGDTLMDLRAQQSGGVLRVQGPLVVNRHANSSTVGALAEQAGRDRETFREITGRYGW